LPVVASVTGIFFAPHPPSSAIESRPFRANGFLKVRHENPK